MLFLMFRFLSDVAVPTIIAYAKALYTPTLMAIVMIAGIALIFSAVNLKVGNGLMSTFVGGIFAAIGYVIRTLVQSLGWIVRNTARAVPRVYRGTLDRCEAMGYSATVSTFLALLVATLFVVVVI